MFWSYKNRTFKDEWKFYIRTRTIWKSGRLQTSFNQLWLINYEPQTPLKLNRVKPTLSESGVSEHNMSAAF